MATIDLGKIKQVWRGTYASGTAYTPDDVVQYTDSGLVSSYICIANTTGNAPSSSGTAHASWNYLAKGGAAGTNGTNGDTFGLANKEIAFKTNAGALDGIAIGTAGQALKVNSGATGYEFGAVAGGKVLQVIQKTDTTHASFTGSADNSPEAPRVLTHLEQAITPSATSSKILITVSLLGSGANNSFPNISHKTSSQVGLGFGTIHTGTALHTNSPNGQSPAMGNDFQNGVSDERIRSANYSFLHSPNTTNAIYYMPTITTWGATVFYYNRGQNDGSAGWYGSGMSSITLMEIGA